jgi:hypothetical protein
MSRRKVSTTVYLEAHQLERLHALSKSRRVPMAALIRGSIDELLARDEVRHSLVDKLGEAASSSAMSASQASHAGVPLSVTLEAGVLGGGAP